MQFRPWRRITAAIQPRYNRDSGRFRTFSSFSDDPYSPVGLLFQLPTSLSLRPLSGTISTPDTAELKTPSTIATFLRPLSQNCSVDDSSSDYPIEI